MNNEKWIYVGIFLDEKSKKKLKKLYSIPFGWKEYFDHTTVVYNDGSERAESAKSICDKLEGKKYKLRITGHGISDKAYAASIEVPSGLPFTNKIAHITLACSATGKPVDSNYIEDWQKILTKDLTVTGTLKIFRG